MSSKSSYITRYLKSGITDQQIVILAAIIRDLDRETARTEAGTISIYFGAALGQLYSEFSCALTRFTHNLVTHNSLDHLRVSLLGHLGVSPWNTDVPHAWPLQVYPRTLAVLAQVCFSFLLVTALKLKLCFNLGVNIETSKRKGSFRY